MPTKEPDTIEEKPRKLTFRLILKDSVGRAVSSKELSRLISVRDNVVLQLVKEYNEILVVEENLLKKKVKP